jgi:hypothetical protein
MRIDLENRTPLGLPAQQKVTFHNTGIASAVIPAGVMVINDGVKGFTHTFPTENALAAPGQDALHVVAAQPGTESGIANGQDVTNSVTPALPVGVKAGAGNFAQGTNPTPATTAVREIGISNTSGTEVTLPAGTYTIADHTLQYTFTPANALTIADGATAILDAEAVTAGPDSEWTNTGAIDPSTITLPSGTWPDDVTVAQTGGENGAAAYAGTTASFDVVLVNMSLATRTIPTGNYTVSGNEQTFSLTVSQEIVLDAGGAVTISVTADSVGIDINLTEDADLTAFCSPSLPAGVTATGHDITQGMNAGAGVPVTVPAGTYIYNDGVRSFPIIISAAATLQPGQVSNAVEIIATAVGVDTNLATGELDAGAITPGFASGIAVVCDRITQGSDPVPSPVQAPSMYFDLSLALSYLVKLNIQLSWAWTFVKISYTDKEPSQSDTCWIRYKTRAEQLAAMTSILDGDRNKYFWAALYLMECQNTTFIVHSEDKFIIGDIFGAWFGAKNTSGQYVGNKLSLLRLSGSRIKPLGWPSWIDSSVNENDADGHQQLRDMNVGFLATISDNTPQECYLSMARGVGDVDKGIPVTMQAIAKFVDYTCSMASANLVTATGTLTEPVLTDEAAYGKIQDIVRATLSRFSSTNGRIAGVELSFPNFADAKVSRTALAAAHSWSGKYKDDLDTVEVSGGLVAE